MGISFLNNINPFLNEVFARFPTGNIYWPLSGVFDYLSYYVAGYYFGTYALKRRTRVIFCLSGLACFAVRMVITSQWSIMEQQLMLQYVGGAILPTALIALAVFLLVKQRFEGRSSKGVVKFVQPLCNCALGIYLVHVFVLAVLLRLWPGWSDMLPAYGIPLMIVIVFAVSMLLTLLLRLVPVIGKRIT
jgi:surface polysaccharide O-acyltransferase-like enzyme